MKKKLIIAIAAVLVIGAGTVIYAVGTGYVQLGAPTQERIDSSVSEAADVAAQKAAEEMRVSSAAQEQALAELEAKIEQLEKELQTPPEVSTTSVPAVPSSAAPQSNSAAVTMSAQTSSSTAPAKDTKAENGGTVFEGYTVTVTDKNTPAEMALGRDWPITKLYFLDANGDSLGSISGTAYNAIIDKYKTPDTWDAPGANGAWEFWFAEKFNDYRSISGNSSPGTDTNQSTGNSAGTSEKDIDTSAYASEVIDLINQKREDKGLNALEVDSELMSHSEVRAEELSVQYSHVRPDGTKEKSECIVMRRDTPSAAVRAWIDSDPHRDAILDESGRFPYHYIGSGCYQDEGGVLYWVITFGV